MSIICRLLTLSVIACLDLVAIPSASGQVAPGTNIVVASFYSIASDSTVEGRALRIAVTRTGDLSRSEQVVFAIGDMTARTGEHYNRPNTRTLNFGPGIERQAIVILTIDDQIVNQARTLSVRLVGLPALGRANQAGATGTITDNDVAPPPPLSRFAIESASAIEGQRLQFRIRRSGSLASARVAFETRDGDALARRDYRPSSGDLDFPEGETIVTVAVPTTARAGLQGTRNMTMALTGLRGGDRFATGTIVDRDEPASFQIANAPPVVEGGTLAFRIARSGSVDGEHTLRMSVTGDTGSLLSTPPTTIVFGSEQRTATYSLPTAASLGDAGTRTIGVQLLSASNGGTIAAEQDSAIGTVTDDGVPVPPVAPEPEPPAPIPSEPEPPVPVPPIPDAPATFTIKGTGGAIGEGQNQVFTINRMGNATAPITVYIEVLDGPARLVAAPTGARSPIIFGPNDGERQISIASLDNDIPDGDRDYRVRLSDAAGNLLAEATGRIIDDDWPPEPAAPWLTILAIAASVLGAASLWLAKARGWWPFASPAPDVFCEIEPGAPGLDAHETPLLSIPAPVIRVVIERGPAAPSLTLTPKESGDG